MSTRVGGVPEVLPPDLIKLAEPSVKCKIPLVESFHSLVKNVGSSKLVKGTESVLKSANQF